MQSIRQRAFGSLGGSTRKRGPHQETSHAVGAAAICESAHDFAAQCPVSRANNLCDCVRPRRFRKRVGVRVDAIKLVERQP
jgi:hypothetical protein